ncbi:DNA mismatch repair endonuclease MutL [Brevibacillus fluminis]|uniref:DNA mismatch repair protein MutL n=1 Tax=Brevibacillus fluminis TaxID=511487 RepID=A0A3M8DXR0_9BACL|nr:DNA mismatch repair endonuclease MutL [Brevibacillus fluminis]RNB91777.1 DNA mismatch repair endonuclease MutL [Brevibacillus fluminis]
MGRIRVLDEHLSNMIAAGEVVERPASVVKELIENAVDAEAKRIEIHIKEGGLDLIRIVDDGVGMDRDDCERAFERHATSKIKSTRDLFSIHTLGFRGEALPSIASVSRTELLSSQASGQVGTRVLIEAGQVKELSDAATVKGTDIQVRELFFNTPARLKYMKSISTEVGHISDYVNRLALTYPGIAFHYTHNDKTILQTSGDGKLLHVIASIYGVQAAKLMLPIEGETLDFHWSGFISKTELTRANRSYLTTLINGRYIRNFALTNAIMRGYHTLLPIGRFPVVCLSIEMDPTLVDVNVHPAKLEARFSKEDELVAAMEASVKGALRKGLTIPQPLATQRTTAPAGPKVVQPAFELPISRESNLLGSRQEQNRLQSEIRYERPQQFEARVREWLPRVDKPQQQQEQFESPSVDSAWPMEKGASQTDTPQFEQVEETRRVQPTSFESGITEQQVPDGSAPSPEDERVPVRNLNVEALQTNHSQRDASVGEMDGERSESRFNESSLADEPLVETMPTGVSESTPSPVVDEAHPAVPPMFPVGQVHGTYIVAQNENGMYLIDQHAAQERIFYEYFMEKLKSESVASQMMLFPHTIECTSQETERLKTRLETLISLGLEIEWFGNRTFIVRAHPHWFPEGSELEVIDELVQVVLETGEKGGFDVRGMREKAAIMMSCKASIKANRYLTQQEMEALLERLRLTTSPFTCPHGRPIIIHFSSYELEKLFKRVM